MVLLNKSGRNERRILMKYRERLVSPLKLLKIVDWVSSFYFASIFQTIRTEIKFVVHQRKTLRRNEFLCSLRGSAWVIQFRPFFLLFVLTHVTPF